MRLKHYNTSIVGGTEATIALDSPTDSFIGNLNLVIVTSTTSENVAIYYTDTTNETTSTKRIFLEVFSTAGSYHREIKGIALSPGFKLVIDSSASTTVQAFLWGYQDTPQ